MPAINLTTEDTYQNTGATDRGFLDDPVRVSGDLAIGAPLLPARVTYDFANLGAIVGNSLNKNLLGIDYGEGLEIDTTKDFWQATDHLHNMDLSVYTKGFVEIGAFASTTAGFASKIMKLPAAIKLAQKQGTMAKIASMFFVEGVAGIPADLIHTKASDASVLEAFTTKETRPAFLEYFVDRTNDSELEGRFKNIVEGVTLGMGVGAAGRIFSSLTASKKLLIASSPTHADLVANAKETLGAIDYEDDVLEAVYKNNTARGILGDDSMPPTTIRTPATEPEILQATRPKDTSGEDVLVQMDVLKVDQPVKEAHPRKLDKVQISSSEYEIKAIIKTMGDETSDELRVLTSLINDPEVPPARKAVAQKYLDEVYQEDGINLMNHKLHGSYVAEDSIRTLQKVDLYRSLTGIRKNKPRSRTNMELKAEALEKLQSGADFKGPNLWKDLEGMGYSKKGLTKFMSTWADTAEEMQEVMSLTLAQRVHLTDTFTLAAKKLSKHPELLSGPIYKEFEDAFRALDELDSAIDGVASVTGRTLNLVNVHPDAEVGKLVQENINMYDLKRKAAKEGKTVDELLVEQKGRPSGFEAFGNVVSKKQEKLLAKFVKDVADGKIVTKREMQEALNAGDLVSVWEAGVRGSLLASTGVLSKSVIAGNATLTAVKNVVDPFFKALINTANTKLLGNADAGFRYADSLIAAQSLFRGTAKAIKEMMSQGNINRALSDSFDIVGKTTREGVSDFNTATRAELTEKLDILKERYEVENAYVKKSILQLSSPIIKLAMPIQNSFIRGIENVDVYFKGINTEATLLREAHSIYYRTGGEAVYGANPENLGLIVDRISKLQKDAIEIINDTRMGPAAAQKQLDALFESKALAPLKEDILRSVRKAKDTAEEVTLQTDLSEVGGPVGFLDRQIIGGLTKMAGDNSAYRVALTSSIPLKKTPVVFLKELQDYTPFAATSNKFWKTLKDGTSQDKIETLAKVASGISFMAAAVPLAMSGRLSGSIDQFEIGKAQELKIPPNSVMIADTWYDISALGPLSTIATATADWSRNRFRDPTQTAATLMSMSMTIAANEGHMATIAEFVDIIQSDNPAKESSHFLINRGLNAITPLKALTNNLGSTIDNGMYRTTIDRELDGLSGFLRDQMARGMKNNIVFRKGADMAGFNLYEADYSLLGDDIYKHSDDVSGQVLNLLGFGTQTAQNSLWRIEAARVGMVPNNARSTTIDGVQLTANEFKNMQRAATNGTANTDAHMNAFVSGSVYRNAGLEYKKKLMQRELGLRLRSFKKRFMESSPRLQKVRQAVEALRLLNMTKDENEPPLGTVDSYLNARTDSTKLNPKNQKNLSDIQELTGDTDE